MAIAAPETRGEPGRQTGLPSAPGDFYDIASLLNENDSQIVARVRAFAERVKSEITKWSKVIRDSGLAAN